MLLWYKDDYVITVGDAAQTSLGHFLTPSGILHDPAATRAISRRELWDVYQFQVWPIHVSTGNNIHGVKFALCLATETPGGYLPLPTSPESGLVDIDGGLRYKGPPLIATHGMGWYTNAAALRSGDHVITLMQYNERREGPRRRQRRSSSGEQQRRHHRGQAASLFSWQPRGHPQRLHHRLVA